MRHRILFVCHGNICRSVSAQYILQEMVDSKDCGEDFWIDSAATSMEEIGNPIYPPMRKTLENHGIPVGDHRARQLKKKDYGNYDLFLGMDEENMYYMDRILGGDPEGKIHYLMEYTDMPTAKIEDPWYTRNFEKAYQDIFLGCQGLLEWFVRQ